MSTAPALDERVHTEQSPQHVACCFFQTVKSLQVETEAQPRQLPEARTYTR